MNRVFCDRLRALRETESRTQAEMAELLRVNRSTYGAYERGTILPPMDKIEALADHFRVSVDYLAGKTNQKHREGPAEVDVSQQVQDVLDYLQDHQAALTLDGFALTEVSRELLIEGIENSIKTARRMNRRD